jgi:hypothetical protein
MTAYSREDHIELIVDVKQFYDRVRIVFPHTELEQLDPEPDSFSGVFSRCGDVARFRNLESINDEEVASPVGCRL